VRVFGQKDYFRTALMLPLFALLYYRGLTTTVPYPARWKEVKPWDQFRIMVCGQVCMAWWVRDAVSGGYCTRKWDQNAEMAAATGPL